MDVKLVPNLKINEVFGISQKILERSYVDRGALDKEIYKYLSRDTHIALRGESKCGKSWLRQKTLPNAIIVQCRLNRSVTDLYIDALSQLGIKLTVESSSKNSLKGTVEATHDLGFALLAKIGMKISGGAVKENESKQRQIGQDLNDLRYVADIIKASGRRLVIEDFHYLSQKEREAFAFDLKAFWDYSCFVILIGIWVESNLLLHLNSDLSGRVQKLSIFWRKQDLTAVIDKGCEALGVFFDPKLKAEIVTNSFETVGILQRLVLETLDQSGISKSQIIPVTISDIHTFELAAMMYADQLNGVYQTFAKRVAKGIRNRSNSTAIYAHMLSVVMNAKSEELSRGMSLDAIFKIAYAKQPRIQKGNLRTVLEKIDGIQVDDDGRGLVLTYDTSKEEISVVDNQLFLYRKFATVRWPWEEMVAHDDGQGLEADNTVE